jgi:hypothetical protein
MFARYLTGSTKGLTDAVARANGIGLMLQPRNCYQANLQAFPAWAADNGAFSPKGFNEAQFCRMLERDTLRQNVATCLFVVAPDRLRRTVDGGVIGDAAGTLADFPGWARAIRAAGFPVALVAQNGLEEMLDRVPWELVDVLFLGGSTEWKLGPGAMHCVADAQRHGKRTHMGRVNSGKRFRHAHSLGVDTVDGTFLRFGANVPRLVRWIDALRQAGLPWRGV